MSAVPRYLPFAGPTLFTAGFRPFFLGAAIWAAIAIPLWLALYNGVMPLPTALAPIVWHAHELIYGYGSAVVAGFLLTAIPNWTGRMPLQGYPLIGLFAAWIAGRAAVLASGLSGPWLTAGIDLLFPIAFTLAMAREIFAGRNWRNLPVLAALTLLGIGNLLVHIAAVGLADTADVGNRLGVAILLMLIALIGGRIIPSFTGNWLRKTKPGVPPPTPGGSLDTGALTVVILALLRWVVFPDGTATSWILVAGGLAAALRLVRWRGCTTCREPLLFVLHVGYGWLACGLLMLGLDGLYPLLGLAGALHALTVGAIGTMTLAVMTRASLGHTGRALAADKATVTLYILINIAALSRVIAAFATLWQQQILIVSGCAWSAAFLLFAIHYGRLFLQPRARS
jgi:uncharacterized protein involved in response to NO